MGSVILSVDNLPLFGRSRSVLGVLLMTMCGCTATPPSSPDTQTSPDARIAERITPQNDPQVPLPEYLPPLELAQRYLNNLVHIRVTNDSHCTDAQTGFGLVVSETPTLTLVAPRHLFGDSQCITDAPVALDFCQSDVRAIGRVTRAAKDIDLALIEVTSTVHGDSLQFTTDLVAPASEADAPVWLLGFDGDCQVKAHGRYLRAAINQTLLVTAPALGGSSGGLLMTEWGGIGIVLAQRGRQRNTLGLSFDAVREFLTEADVRADLLADAYNVPPQSPLSARQTYASYLSNYLFYARQIKNTFSRGEYSDNYLLQNIPPYNNAFIQLNNQKALFIPHLNQFWPQLSAESANIIQGVQRVHDDIKALNVDLDALVATRSPTPEFERKLNNIGAQLDTLEQQHRALLEKLGN